MAEEYYIYKTQVNDRWDKIANIFYGNCYKISPIIESNFQIAITPFLEEGIEIIIPKEENKTNQITLPEWKKV